VSRIFENSNYDSSKQSEFRNGPSLNRRLKRDSSDTALRSLRAPMQSTRSARDLHAGGAAGQFERSLSKKKLFQRIIEDTAPMITPRLREFNRPAGMIVSREGSPIIASHLTDHVKKLIKGPFKNPAPIKELDTTYNREHSRSGFSPCHIPEKKSQTPPKISAPEGPYNSAKRFERVVKSSHELPLEEPLHDKSETMMTVNVPEGIDQSAMRRELALKGYHVVKTHFEHKLITNERTGRGFIQVRAANQRYINEIKDEIEKIGVKLSKNSKGTPNRNFTWK
jgi:hypothetical protein